MNPRTVIASTCLVLLALAVRASAQPAQPVETPESIARRHFDQGEAYFKAGAFDLAAAEYNAAYDAVPEPVLLFNAGLAWENHGDAAKAVASYDRYLATAPDGIKATEARARRDVLARRVEDEHAAAERAEQERVEQERLAAERAEQERAEQERAAGQQTSRPSLVPAIAAYSVGAAALGVGIVYGLRARSISDDLEGDLETGPPVDTSDPRFDDGHDAALIADVAFVVAGTAAVVGAYFTYRAVSGRRRAPVTVAPSVGANLVGATIGGQW